MTNCNIMKSDSKQLFLFGARWAFGFWLLYIGVMKWVGGADGFVGYISGQFANTWPPSWMILALAWIILVLEPLLGALLLLGKAQRLVWILTAKLMFILMFGQTLLGNYATVSNNWQYFFIALIAASLSEPCECPSKSK